MESKFLDQDVDVESLANKGIVIGCFVGRNYNKIFMETVKLTDNIRVTNNGLESGVDRKFQSSDSAFYHFTKELMHRQCGTNNRAQRCTWTFIDPCKPEMGPGAQEESASPALLATPAMNARNTTNVYIWRLDTGCGRTLYMKFHSHNTSGKRHNNP